MVQNLTIVININTHKIAITTNPNRGDLKPKNAAFQRILTTSWAAKMLRAIFARLSKPSRHTKRNAHESKY
jgi:hypothetical protein